jgi:hypothetical protein
MINERPFLARIQIPLDASGTISRRGSTVTPLSEHQSTRDATLSDAECICRERMEGRAMFACLSTPGAGANAS